jgi:hypothetical protein
MAAGLGFKDFTTGEVLTAADVDGYLMQGIWVFASTAARDAAVTAPAEGNFAFTKDTNSLWYYDGAAWVSSGATGDIEGVTAGIGISGGGTSGTVTVTNSMATAIDAKGDLIGGTGADTFARLAVGANDTVLTADSTAATGLKWAAAAGGGSMTLLSTTTLSGASTTISSISGSYKNLYVEVQGISNASAANQIFCIPNNSTSKMTYVNSSTDGTGSGFVGYRYQNDTNINMTYTIKSFANTDNLFVFTFYNYASTAAPKPYEMIGGYQASGGSVVNISEGYFNDNTSIQSLVFTTNGGNWAGGTVRVYGVN